MSLTGLDLLHDPSLNKGTAFSDSERDVLNLRGLLPPKILTVDQQVDKVLESFRAKLSPIEKYIYLISLQDRNETLFYRVLMDHLEEMLPIVYTPTVGRACQLYGHLWRRSRGLFISAQDRGKVARILENWPYASVRIIVVTDGERILGLGDLGANGMGIPVGKLSLYTACAGIAPHGCLPVTLDVGTENESLLADPLYLGLPQRRWRGEAYDELVDEFMASVAKAYPQALVQFEDFGTANAFRLLRRYRDRACCFNDDIQGTASVCLAALYSALRLVPGSRLSSHKILFLGAGEAGAGIASLVVSAMKDEGLSEPEALARCWFVDSKGLVVKSRANLAEHKQPFAHDYPHVPDLLSAVHALKPTALIGVSGQGQAFHRDAVVAMAEINERPIVFALSNPTSNSECTAEQAYEWTGGRAIFASGSPFAPVAFQGQTFYPSQANNVYVFPGVGLGIMASAARRVTDEMFLTAARVLGATASESDLAHGRLLPPIEDIRAISASVAVAVAELAYSQRLATAPRPTDLRGSIEAAMYQPVYEPRVSRTP
jgi:malate dehydrogenase (oxaloacetate-decarboxylating)(NADP+)